ncbi:MAG TPA: LamG-like jellyroll fold domain-containing protein, partial [Verrucomicrobiae bacterium]|nr:LamG-like jellyroll fold domain-containing protein [Verrucomicrobiae bacterium]
MFVLGTVVFVSLNSAFADISVPESTLSCVPPAPGLVGWWPGEGSADDVIGGDNGTLEGGATFAPGKVGQGFRFDGTNGYVQIPDSAALKPTNVTVEAWVWLDPSLPSGRGGEQIVFKKNTWSAWFEGYSLLKETIDNGDGTFSDRFQFCISRYGDQVIINSQTIAQRGVWYHVAATYDGNRSVLYVNGVAEASATAGFALDYDTTPVFIGTTGTWPPYLSMFGGIIDEVSIYHRALSSNEIGAIYRAGSAGKCASPPLCVPPPAGLVSWWPGEGNADDIVGTNNGTLVDGVTFAAGRVGQAFHLDGTNQYVQIADSPSLKPANVSVEAWVKLDTLVTPGANIPGQEVIVFKKNTRNGNFEGYTLLKDRVFGRDCFSFAIASAGGLQVHALSSTIPQVGAWYHLVGTYDGTTLRLYVNGELEGSAYAGFPLDYGTRPVFFGRTGEFWVANFGGSIDEVSIYSRALAADEVQSLYHAGSAGKCTPLMPPLIQVQPQGQTVNAGDTATFSVVAEGTLPLYYQWFFDSNALMGATSPTLTLTNTRPDQGGIYSVVVSNAVGVAVSSNALLHVNQIPVADASATVARVVVCTDTNAAVVLNGTRSYDLDGDPLQYLWFENGMNTPLATGAVAEVMLPPGTYPIALVVSDGLAADTNVVVVKVLTATQAIEDLIAVINGSDIKQPQPLIACLMAASDSIARGDL